LRVGERVVAFRVLTIGAGIVAVPHIPMGWSISIDNDASWATNVSGSIQVGAAAVEPEALRNFLIIELAPEPSPPLKLTGEIVASGFKGGSMSGRHIVLTGKQFELTRVR